MVKVYKLLGPDMKSAFMDVTRHGYKYVVGLNIHPRMFVFETAEQARYYGYKGTSVWECETSSARPAPSHVLHWHKVDIFYAAFWSGQWFPDEYVSKTPEGTLLCDDLIVIRSMP